MVNVGVVLGTGYQRDIGKAKKVKTDHGKVNMYELSMGGKDVLGVKRHEALEVPHIMPHLAYAQAFRLNNIDIVYATSA